MARARRDSDVTIIIFLGSTVIVCIVGIIVMSVANQGADTQPLVAIASAAVGALATKITQESSAKPTAEQNATQNDDDALATIVGRAATRSVIAEMMRQMSAPPSGTTPVEIPKDTGNSNS